VTALAMLALVIPVNLIVVPDSRSPALLALPLCLGLLAVMTYGFGLGLAALNVYFRDVQHILGALLLPWFFLTPVFYTPDALPPGTEELRWLTVALEWGNFVAPYVIIVRDTLFEGDWPSPAHLGYCVVVSAAALAGGMWLFRRLDGEMAVEL
jgi:lipopolysaccharide transport system permease protein